MKPEPTTPRFNEKADAELNRIYEQAKAQTTLEKIEALDKILEGKSNFTGFGGNKIVTDDQKLGCLEYEYLGNLGLIELTLA